MRKVPGGFIALGILFGLRTAFYLAELVFVGRNDFAPWSLGQRALHIGTVLISALVVAGLFSGERWVARAMELWIALWVVRNAGALLLTGPHPQGVLTSRLLFTAVEAAAMYLTVFYVRSNQPAVRAAPAPPLGAVPRSVPRY